jgi:hypothetical protein
MGDSRRRYRGSALCAVALMGLVIMGSACGGVLVIPEPNQGGQVDLPSRLVSKELHGIQITVQSMAWRYDPYYLEDYFTPLLVFIRNTTDEPLSVQYQDFVLVDDRGNQYNAITPQMVDRALKGRGAPYPYPPPIYYPLAPMGFVPYGYEPYPAYYADIMLLSLHETKVVPHAQVRGFLYFQKATVEGQRLTLTASVGGRSQEFQFSIQH